jgi:hypothetical protein
MKKARGQQSPATVRTKGNNRGRHEFKGENVFEFRSWPLKQALCRTLLMTQKKTYRRNTAAGLGKPLKSWTSEFKPLKNGGLKNPRRAAGRALMTPKPLSLVCVLRHAFRTGFTSADVGQIPLLRHLKQYAGGKWHK